MVKQNPYLKKLERAKGTELDLIDIYTTERYPQGFSLEQYGRALGVLREGEVMVDDDTSR